MLHANLTALSSVEPELLPIKVFALDGGLQTILFAPKMNANYAEARFMALILSSRLYALRVTPDQSVLLRQIRGRGHFPLRDTNGGHTTRSAISENPMLHANFTVLSCVA